jgi:NRPS condensation-like uncharacterized protein
MLDSIKNKKELEKVALSLFQRRVEILEDKKFPPFKFFFCENFDKDKSSLIMLLHHAFADGASFIKVLYLMGD